MYIKFPRLKAKYCFNTYDVDELNHGQSELDRDDFAEVHYGSYERIIAVTVKQRLHQSHFIVAAKTCVYQRNNIASKWLDNNSISNIYIFIHQKMVASKKEM